MKVKERQNCQEDLLEEVTFALKSMSKDKERAWLLRGIVMRSVWLLGNKQTNKQNKTNQNKKKTLNVVESTHSQSWLRFLSHIRVGMSK